MNPAAMRRKTALNALVTGGGALLYSLIVIALTIGKSVELLLPNIVETSGDLG